MCVWRGGGGGGGEGIDGFPLTRIKIIGEMPYCCCCCGCLHLLLSSDSLKWYLLF